MTKVLNTKNMSEFKLLQTGFRITSAQIFYAMPDHPALVQEFFWQEYDLHPQFPILNTYLRFWKEHIDGPLRKVLVAQRGVFAPTELKIYGSEFRLH